MGKKNGFQQVWSKGRADEARAELGIPLCVRARGELAAGAQGCWRCSGKKCYQSDPRDTGQLIAPEKEEILLQCKAGWAQHASHPALMFPRAAAASLPSEELQHLGMGTWLQGRSWEWVTSTWSFLCRLSRKAILKEYYMDLLLINACRDLSSLDGFGNVAPRAGLDYKARSEMEGGEAGNHTAVSILLACSKASAQWYSPKFNHQQMSPLPQQQHWGCSVNGIRPVGLWSIFQLYIQQTSFFMLGISIDIWIRD